MCYTERLHGAGVDRGKELARGKGKKKEEEEEEEGRWRQVESRSLSDMHRNQRQSNSLDYCNGLRPPQAETNRNTVRSAQPYHNSTALAT